MPKPSGRTARTYAMQLSSASVTNSRILLLLSSTCLLMKRRTRIARVIIICLKRCCFYCFLFVFYLSVR